MLLKKLGTLLLCSFSLLTAKAQQPKEKSSLLWEISGKDLQTPSWLYGTIHIACKEDIQFSSATQDALKKAKSLFLEINMADQQEMQSLQSALMMPEGYSFKNLFNDGEYQQLAKWCQDSLHMDIAALDRFKPLVLFSLITRQHFNSACSDPAYCEAELMKLAQAQQLPVRGLEKATDQVAIFDSIPDKEEAKMLLESIEQPEKSQQLYRRMLTAYRAQNITDMTKLMAETEDIARFKDILLDQRNRNWIPIITGEASKASTFFAVGAGHLGGDTGVIELLRKQGYTVKPI
ncbi:TraB/GumN family protein [Chitinophaga rhizophila]|uniref:TraB/GumN family protein n=1 Tax=Chitinophaga rhizophila TaxID=2866212 RepID=A0ABS7G6G2_9BACT|nr:TraB/GumN family protein [Chitinophaga rhizophila]MBW8683242.1 TraB/GumN family protein [Chitinophaga rhizophila]